MKLLIDDRWIGLNGIGRYARALVDRFPSEEVSVMGVGEAWPIKNPMAPISLSLAIAKFKPEVFWSPGFIPPFTDKVPFIITIHDLIHLGFGSRARVFYYNSVIRPLSKKAFRIITDSEYSRQEIINWTGLPIDRVTVAYCGVNADYTSVGERYNFGRPYLLYVGNRRNHKNLVRLVRAFAASKFPRDVALAFSGDADEQLMRLAKRVSIADQLVFLGRIEESHLPAVYRGALGVVFVSLYEGFGLPALEAMACGIPVLTSNVTSLPEVVGDAAICVDPYDIDAIAQGIDRLIGDAQLRTKLRDDGIERAKEFTWDRTARIVWGVLQQAAEQGVENRLKKLAKTKTGKVNSK